jgi:hypothetical protein
MAIEYTAQKKQRKIKANSTNPIAAFGPGGPPVSEEPCMEKM